MAMYQGIHIEARHTSSTASGFLSQSRDIVFTTLNCQTKRPPWAAWFNNKDYRRQKRTKPENLFKEIARKVRDTLAGLAVARIHANDPQVQAFADDAALASKLRVAYLLQQPKHPSRLFPQVVDPANGRIALRKAVRAVDRRAFLGNAADLAATTAECGGATVTRLRVAVETGHALGRTGAVDDALAALASVSEESTKLRLGSIVAEAELRRAGILLETERVDEASVSATAAADRGAAMFDRGLGILAYVTAGLAVARTGGDPEPHAKAAVEAAASVAAESDSTGGGFLERPDIAGAFLALTEALDGTGHGDAAAEIRKLLEPSPE